MHVFMLVHIYIYRENNFQYTKKLVALFYRQNFMRTEQDLQLNFASPNLHSYELLQKKTVLDYYYIILYESFSLRIYIIYEEKCNSRVK